jgi:hypothetical protein
MRVTKMVHVAVAMGAGLLLQACIGFGVPGNGQVVTQDRTVAAFGRVVADTAIQVNIHRAAAFSVRVTLDSNLQGLVRTTVEGDTLSITDTRPYSTAAATFVDIGMPSLSGIENAGSGDLTAAGFVGDAPLALFATGSGNLSFDGTCGSLDVDVEGSGDMILAGHAGHLAATANGSGNLVASTLLASNGAEIDVNGSGDAKVDVLGSARLSTSGSGSIDANLNAGLASFSVSGSGDITWTGDDQIGGMSASGSGSIERR